MENFSLMMHLTLVSRLLLLCAVLVGGGAGVADPIVIAHRGASGYLPEHTLEAYSLAYGMGADYIEQDLVLTKDGHFVALHDIHLEGTTDVESVFPDRKREDGRWYAADFTLAEIKTLSVHERLGNRFPVGKAHFEVPTFEEAIELIQGLNTTLGRNVGIYPELKGVAFHRKAGFDPEAKVLDVLTRYGYTGADARVFIQCFEFDALERLRKLKTEVPLILLISNDKRQAGQRTKEGLATVSKVVDGVGPSKSIIEKNPAFVGWAHEAGLAVHPYTIRKDDVPEAYENTEDELAAFYNTYGVDGVFTDFPDSVRAFLDARPTR